MKKNILCKILLGLLVITASNAFPQNVAINGSATGPVNSAVLDLSANTTGGFLLPYINTAQMNALTSVPNSLLIYNSDNNCIEGYFIGSAPICNCWQVLYCPCTTVPTTPLVTGTTSLCAAAVSTYTVTTTPNGATDYTWTITGGTFSNGLTTITGPSSIQPITWGSPASSTTYTINVTGTNACGTTATAGTLAVAINPGTSITAGPTPTSQTINGLNTAGSAITVTAVGGGLTYQWYSCNAGGGAQVSLGAANGAQTATYTPPGAPGATTLYYNCIVTGTCAPLTVTSSVATVIVTACAPPVVTTNPSGTNQCYAKSAAAAALTVAFSGTAPTYQWYSNAANSNAGGVSIGGATGTSYTPPTTTIGTVYYYCVATNACGTATSNVSGSITTYGILLDASNSVIQNNVITVTTTHTPEVIIVFADANSGTANAPTGMTVSAPAGGTASAVTNILITTMTHDNNQSIFGFVATGTPGTYTMTVNENGDQNYSNAAAALWGWGPCKTPTIASQVINPASTQIEWANYVYGTTLSNGNPSPAEANSYIFCNYYNYTAYGHTGTVTWSAPAGVTTLATLTNTNTYIADGSLAGYADAGTGAFTFTLTDQKAGDADSEFQECLMQCIIVQY